MPARSLENPASGPGNATVNLLEHKRIMRPPTDGPSKHASVACVLSVFSVDLVRSQFWDWTQQQFVAVANHLLLSMITKRLF